MAGLAPENVSLLLIDASYLPVAFLFIMGLKAMSSLLTARRGIVMAFAKKAPVIPGYGMAVAQAQHTVWELCRLLIERRVDVRLAIRPVARTDKSRPICGMPILNADTARNTLVVKRGQGAGFSGIENHLFYLDNTRMVYGGAWKDMSQLVQAVKAVG